MLWFDAVGVECYGLMPWVWRLSCRMSGSYDVVLAACFDVIFSIVVTFMINRYIYRSA